MNDKKEITKIQSGADYVYLCYAQNRLFYYNGEEYVKIISDFCVIPDLDQELNVK